MKTSARAAAGVAIVHDWLTGMRGGEAVLEAIAELFPSADLFTLVAVPANLAPALSARRIRTSWLQRLPGIATRYRATLPFMPHAISRFDLSGYDLVISSSHCVAKGARKPPGAVHVSYVHAPMRYMWDRYDDYFGPGRASVFIRAAARLIRGPMRRWDRRVSGPHNVDLLISNSRYIADRVREAYGRESLVIHPFADLSRFRAPRNAGPHYLSVGALAPYKRIDLAVEAFNRLRLPLVVVGDGQDAEKLRRMAGPTVEFRGALPHREIAALYSTCRAFVFPGREDFGITPLEAMAAGAPVIAFGEGGAAETVTARTGVFFREQSIEALAAAVLAIERGTVRIREEDCRARAACFTRERFRMEFAAAVRTAWAAAKKDPALLERALAADPPPAR